ncbi:MAG: hypothetical protein KGI33_07280 [Thaumarchaeota archaeon]|nr:hypothetical protein [Nitrososphaerota archaeon]
MRTIFFVLLAASVAALSVWSGGAYAYAIEISTSNGGTACPQLSGTWNGTTDTCSTTGFNLPYGSSLQVDPGVTVSVSYSYPHFGQISAFEGINMTNQGVINFTREGTLVMSPHDEFNNTGTINFYSNGQLDYAGTFENMGTVNFDGSCASPCINNADFNDFFMNVGKVNFYGTASPGTVDVQNSATFNNTQAATNEGAFFGNLTIGNGGTLYNSGTFNNDFGIYVLGGGSITNKGSFGGVGFVRFAGNGNLNNDATFVIRDAVLAHNVFNRGTMNVTGQTSSLGVSGNLTNYVGGVIHLGWGSIRLGSGSAYLDNYGRVDIVPLAPGFGASGEIYDAGPTVYNYCGSVMESVGVNPYPPVDVGCGYSATFAESGIPAGTAWGVTVNSVRYDSTSDSTTVSGLEGEVPYTYDAQVAGAAGTRFACSTGCSGTITSAAAETAGYQTQYLLTVTTSPSGLAPAPSASPSSASGYYASGTGVTLTASQVQGMVFLEWQVGHANQTLLQNSTMVAMDGPVNATAVYQSPAGAIPALISQVGGMNLQQGIQASLDAKLSGALDSLESGNAKTAVNRLDALVHEVDAQAGKHITAAQAELLDSFVREIIGAI